jgi:ATPase complex subunit ATP10
VATEVIIPEVAAAKFPELPLESPGGGALRLLFVAPPPEYSSPEAAGAVVPDASLVCLSFRASSQVGAAAVHLVTGVLLHVLHLH